MSIENTLERIAVALEKLVEAKGTPVMTISQAPIVNIPVVEPVAESPAPMPDEFAERDAIKAELAKLGIPFNNKSKTEVLKKLLEDQELRKFAAEKQAAAAPAATVQAVATSIEAVREAVKKFAAIKGKDKAVGLLGKYKASMVSELPADKYNEVLEIISKELEA